VIFWSRQVSPRSCPARSRSADKSAGNDLKITDIKTYLVGVGSRNLVFVKVETDQGIHGIGEAYSYGPALPVS